MRYKNRKKEITEFQIKQDCFQSPIKCIVNFFKKALMILIFSVVTVFFIPLFVLNMLCGVGMDPIINKMEELFPDMIMDGVEE